MKLLLINPNTTATMTERMLSLGRDIVRPGVMLQGATGRFGARYVASRASYAVAGHAALDCYAEFGADADAIVLACFGDPALFALRELAHQPVVGMAEASCLRAARYGRFGIVTGGERWGPMLEEFVASIGLAPQLVDVSTVAPTGADIARDPDGSLALLSEAARALATRGANAVILGGAGLAGLAARLTQSVPVLLIDSLEAVVQAGIEAALQNAPKPSSGTFAATPSVETIGLSASLTHAFADRQKNRAP